MRFGMSTVILFSSLALCAGRPAAADEPIRHWSAGSLKAALTKVGAAFTAETGIKVDQTWKASGLIARAIEGGEKVDVFTSANMEHPLALEKAGRMGPVVLFARNELCAFAMPRAGVAADGGNLLERLLDPGVKLGTSTPKADPAGDYAFGMFAKAETVVPGARAKLEAKALQLTGGPNSPPPPADRNVYAAQLASGAADVMLAYCTNVGPIAKELPEAKAVRLPPALAMTADYGLTVAVDAPPAAYRFALYLLTPKAQAILAEAGFDAPTLPRAAP